MKTGHVGAEYVEHVMRFKRKLAPAPPALRLGDPVLDAITLPEPDLTRYDDISQRRPLRDPGDPPQASDEQESS